MEYEETGEDDANFEKRREEDAALQARADVSQAVIDKMPAGRERDLVLAIDEALSSSLGTPSGYIPSFGAPMTARLKQALSAYGITPDYGCASGFGGRRYNKR